jgi:hypothetical protein
MGLFIYRFDILGKNLMPTFVQFTKYDKLWLFKTFKNHASCIVLNL